MSKLSKEDFDEYLGKEPFYSSQDKKRFFKRLYQPHKRKKNWFPQFVTAVVIFGLLIVGFQMVKGEFLTSSDYNNINDKWKIAESKEQVDEYFETITPGLVRAENLDLVSEVNKTIPLTKASTLQIEKVWYNSDQIYVYYSIGLPDPDVMTEDQVAPKITNFYVQPDNKERFPGQNIVVYPNNINTGEGIIFKNRFYQRASLTQINDHENNPLAHFDDVLTTDITVNLFDENVTRSDVELPVHYDKKKEPTITLPINKTIQQNNVTLTFDQMDIGVTKNQINGKINTQTGDYISRIKGTVTAKFENGNQIPIGFSQSTRSQDSFSFKLPAFNSIPKEVTVDIELVGLIGDDSFEFSLDVSDYEEKLSNSSGRYEKNVHKQIGEVMDTKIYLEDLLYDDRGIDFVILYEAIDSNQSLQLIETSASSADSHDNIKLPNYVYAVNERGQFGVIGETGAGHNHQFNLLLEKSFIEKSEQVDITFENLLYNVKINDSISFPVSAEK